MDKTYFLWMVLMSLLFGDIYSLSNPKHLRLTASDEHFYYYIFRL